MKNISILIIFVFISYLAFSQSDGEEPVSPDTTVEKEEPQENISDKGKFKKLTKYEITRILFWSNYGVTGFTALTNVFAHLGYSLHISQEISSHSNTIKDYGGDPDFLPQLASFYPAFMFGFHFIGSGLAFIPVAGGISYGVFLLSIGTAFSAIRMTSDEPFDFYDLKVSANIPSEVYDKAWDIYNKMFDPTPYYLVGGLSILFGVGEIITSVLYIKERNKKRYPYMQKIFSFSPNSFYITVKFDS